MEPLQPASAIPWNHGQSVAKRRLVVGFATSLAMLAGLSGCLPELFTTDPNSQVALSTVPCQIHTRWDHQVHFTANTEDKGKEIPQIVGRVYLFGSDLKTPIPARGTMQVYLYNDMPDAPDKETPLEKWVIATNIVKVLERRDAAGWGYTMLLPWTTYRPDITHVRLMVRFDQVGSKIALYSDTVDLTFENPTTPKVDIAHKQSGPKVPMNGMVLDQSRGMVLDPTSAAMIGSGQKVPVAAANAQPIGMAISESLENGQSPTTSVTTSAPSTSGDNIPFIVPRAGAVMPGNRPQ
jgi:hypothetical protein